MEIPRNRQGIVREHFQTGPKGLTYGPGKRCETGRKNGLRKQSSPKKVGKRDLGEKV